MKNNKLREFRTKSGASVIEIADYLDMTPAAYRRYERGEVEPKISQAVLICNYLNCTLDDIWNPQATPKQVDVSYTLKPGQTFTLAMECPIDNGEKLTYQTSLKGNDNEPTAQKVKKINDK